MYLPPRYGHLPPASAFTLLVLCLCFSQIPPALVAHAGGLQPASQDTRTPLHLAARDGDIEAARRLIADGADVNARANGAHTPLMAAAAYGEVEMVKFLLAHGADSTLKDEEGRTALERARQNGHAAVVGVLAAAPSGRRGGAMSQQPSAQSSNPEARGRAASVQSRAPDGDDDEEAEAAQDRNTSTNTVMSSRKGNNPAPPQAQGRIFKPGEEVETGGGYVYKIIRCTGEGSNEECVVDVYRENALTTRNFSVYASDIRAGEQRVLAAKRRQDGAASDDDTKRSAPLETEKGTASTTTSAQCSFYTPTADTSAVARASEQLFKRKIYDIYNIAANGTGSAPLKVGVTFLSFQVGRPFTNTVRVDPGRGALRINDAAPVNATIYPVKSEHIVCEQYRDGTQRKRVENKYACFKNRDGEWVCGADGIPKTIQLN